MLAPTYSTMHVWGVPLTTCMQVANHSSPCHSLTPAARWLLIAHKILLSMTLACVKSGGRVLVGVSGDALLKKKALKDLVQPQSLRIANVVNFCRTVAPTVALEVTLIALIHHGHPIVSNVPFIGGVSK